MNDNFISKYEDVYEVETPHDRRFVLKFYKPDFDRLFFTSDHHYGHKNIIKYVGARRELFGLTIKDEPTLEHLMEMGNLMTKEWNDTVLGGNLTVHLGDLTLAGLQYAKDIFRRINSAVYQVPGGHDHRWFPKFESTLNVKKLSPLTTIEIHGYTKRPIPIVCCHYPMASWDRSHHGSIHVHGHVHDTWKDISRESEDTQLPPDMRKGVRINVCLEMWDFKPVSLRQILDIGGYRDILT